MTDTVLDGDVRRGPGNVAASRTVRLPLLALGALALGTALSTVAVGTADAAYYYYGYPSFYRAGSSAVEATQPRVKRSVRRAKEAEPKKAAAPERRIHGPLAIVVSIGEQRVRVFDATTQVAEAPISSGNAAHPTLQGVFTVIQKDRYHRSNLYGDAPMPYMQRLTWSGTAMHTGVLPGYPASHGCIRLPNSFAMQLWGMTNLGTRVIVARHGVTPAEFSHPQLALLKKKPEAATPVAGTAGKSASADTTVTDGPNPAVPAMDQVAPNTDAPAAAPAPAEPPAAAPAATAPAATPSAPLVEYGPPRPLKPGPVAIFVSKKEGKLFVRKGFEPIYETPVSFARADGLLGTHVFTATAFEENGQTLRWTVMSMPGDGPGAAAQSRKNRRGEKIEAAVPVGPSLSAKEALDRIELPAEAVEKLAELMSPGASLIISDKGLGYQTGKGTEFIVLTR